MLEGLEARAPYLERTLVEVAMRLPGHWKVARLSTKRVLRRALEGVVPDAVLRRRKRGFAVPVARSLCGTLGARLRERLDSSTLARTWLDPTLPLELLAQHQSGQADHARRLYPLLALLEWGERWLR
jgi:asparagine synthase (glutamine-hydrolysing)